LTGLPKSTIYYHLKDLQILGVVKDSKSQVRKTGNIPIYNCADEDDNLSKQLVIKLPPIPKKVLLEE
jgi:predicted transcriptional regulator